MKVVENTSFHTLYSIYIYINSSVIQLFLVKSAKYTKKQTITRENDGDHCAFSRKRAKTNHFAAFSQIFRAFHSVFAKIALCGNDNGEFTHDSVAELTTHTRHRCKNKSTSRNIRSIICWTSELSASSDANLRSALPSFEAWRDPKYFVRCSFGKSFSISAPI